MKKSIIEIYALAICFVTVVCLVIALGVGIYDLVEIGNPEFTISSYEYKRHQSNESFIRKDCEKDKEIPSDEEITRQRLESYQHTLSIEQRNAFQSLTLVIIIVILGIIVFFIHWRIAKRARNSESTNV